jgi:hypothetical protein
VTGGANANARRYNAGMPPSHFATTHWSLVLAARDRADGLVREPLL